MNMPKRDGTCLLSIDIGTTHAKALLCRAAGGLIGQESEGYATYYPEPGLSEQNPEEVLAAVRRAVSNLMARSEVAASSVGAIVLDGIWQSVLAVDRQGTPLCPALTWADTRAFEQNNRLKASLDPEQVKRRTGCTLHPMYLPSRLAWMREHAADVFTRADRFISIKEYVIDRLFGDRRVDHSTASGSGLWNMHSMTWDDDLLVEIGLGRDRLSECVEPTSLLSGLKREAAAPLGLLPGTPGVIGAADGACAHLGSVGLSDHRVSFTVGTGAALRKRMSSPATIPGSEAWCYYLADGNWLLGGVLHGAGNTLQWFADNLMPADASGGSAFEEMNRLAEQVPPGAEGLVFVPLLGGERCPNYMPDARGSLFGLAFHHTRAHLVRALMEGMAYQLSSIYRMLTADAGPELVVTGGILKSPVWMQIVADIFGKPLWLPRMQETTAWGGALIGMKAIGELARLDESEALVETVPGTTPDAQRREAYRRLQRSYDRFYDEFYKSGRYQSCQED